MQRDELRALGVLDLLLGGATDALGACDLDALGEEGRALARARIARACARWLVDGGGWRERAVLRDGRRARGRAWDAALRGGFTLRFTRASWAVWSLAIEALPALRLGVDLSTRRALGARARALMGGVRGATGDWIFAAIAADVPLQLAPRDRALWRGWLARGAPLLSLMDAHSTPSPELIASIDEALSGPDVRVIECAEARLAEGWSSAALRALDARSTRSSVARCLALAETLRAWVERVLRARRADLTRPAMTALRSIILSLDAEADPRARVRALGAARSVAERDEVLSATRSMIDTFDRLAALRRELAQVRYGEERYDEAQVFLGDFDGILAPMRARHGALSTSLSQRIG